MLFFRAMLIILVNAIFIGIGMFFVGILNVIGSIFSGLTGSGQTRPSSTHSVPFDHSPRVIPTRLPIPSADDFPPRINPLPRIPFAPRTRKPTPKPPKPRPKPKPKPKPKAAPTPKPTTTKAGLIHLSPARRRPTVTVSNLGVDSSWDNPRKRAHLVQEFARANSRMQVLRDPAQLAECQSRLDRITRAIMELDAAG
jgi:hypothetical protein